MNRNKGSIVVFIVFIGMALAVISLTVANVFLTASRQNVYLDNMDRTYQLAETGLTTAIQQLSRVSDIANFDSTPVVVSEENGIYESHVVIATIPINPIYYVVTTATRTVNGKRFVSTLHSYLRVSNSSEYFLAVPDDVTISHPVNIAEGKIFASSVTFYVDGDPNTTTFVKRVEYQNICYTQSPPGPRTQWSSGSNPEIVITDPPSAEPVQISQGLLFPQVLDTDMSQYMAWAGPHTAIGTFSGEIWPPGYVGADPLNPPAGDNYRQPLTPGHTEINAHHIYYYNGNMSIEGTIHGQILFVANGDIVISSSIVVATDNNFPGAGFASSSTAHQAVLITRGNVYIKNSLEIPAAGSVTETIQAFILAPTGKLIPMNYADTTSHARLVLDFSGSMILSSMKSSPLITSVFQGGRTYSYMDSLRVHPPPYLPMIVDIYFSMENSTGDGLVP